MSGASNAGFEPYSEYYASQLAERIGVHAISYSLSKWKGILCSACELFTSKETAFLPVGRVVSKGGIKAVEAYYSACGQEFLESLYDMYLFDALTFSFQPHKGYNLPKKRLKMIEKAIQRRASRMLGEKEEDIKTPTLIQFNDLNVPYPQAG